MSIESLGSRKDRRYKVRWREGDKARSRTFNRKHDAENFELEVRRRKQTGELASLNKGPTLDEYARRYWDEHVTTLSPGFAADLRRCHGSEDRA